jgi:phage pi2 protein 07
MGFDISLKLNKVIDATEIRDKFAPYVDNQSDSISCLSRGFCNLVLNQHFPDNEPLILELSKALEFNCSFIEEPKANHFEEDEETRFKFGWVKSDIFLSNLVKLNEQLELKPQFSKNLDLSSDWIYYFEEDEENNFRQDIRNLIGVIEICNQQEITEICYVVS